MHMQLPMQPSIHIAKKSNVCGLHMSTDATFRPTAIESVDEEDQEAASSPAGSMLYDFQLYQMCEAKLPAGLYRATSQSKKSLLGGILKTSLCCLRYACQHIP